jgi:hypothetical protein
MGNKRKRVKSFSSFFYFSSYGHITNSFGLFSSHISVCLTKLTSLLTARTKVIDGVKSEGFIWNFV